MHTRKHAWNDGASAPAREADAGAGSSARLLRSTQSITFSTSNDFRAAWEVEMSMEGWKLAG